MNEDLFWLKDEGVKTIHKLMGLIQWSDMGRCDEHKTSILKELFELERRLNLL